jgi:hypothetical protein
LKHQDACSLSDFLYYLNGARSEIINPFREKQIHAAVSGDMMAKHGDNFFQWRAARFE